MTTLLTISAARPKDVACDQQELFAQGLEQIQSLAERTWTDHNIHDPGITILEVLCYALTDLAYRAMFPMVDLLTSDSVDAKPSPFFTPRQILTNRALTTLDYRKLLIDLPGIKNAWIYPVELTAYADPTKHRIFRANSGGLGVREVRIRGFHQAVLEYMDGADRAAVKRTANAHLHANRNLCEDFLDAIDLEVEEFRLCGNIEIDPRADAVEIAAKILSDVQAYLAPPIKNYTRTELQFPSEPGRSSLTIEEIFDGPALDCGFLDSRDVQAAEIRTEIRLSDVIGKVMSVPGVLAVREMIINSTATEEASEAGWVIPVAPGKQPRLVQDSGTLVFFARNFRFHANSDEVQKRLKQFKEAEREKLETKTYEDIPIPLGVNRQLERYSSFQLHLPAVYGLSHEGLPDRGTESRKALALQLQGYLLFFDQVMTDYCAQLGRLGELFSLNPLRNRTYFTQVVESLLAPPKAPLQPSNDKGLYFDPNNQDAPATAETVVNLLRSIVEPEGTSATRRNRFLNHLLARVAERFDEYASVMDAEFGQRSGSMIRPKCDFLTNYPSLGANRGAAYNRTLKTMSDQWNSENVSGVEHRICKLLGIRNHRRRDLADVQLDDRAFVVPIAATEFGFRLQTTPTGSTDPPPQLLLVNVVNQTTNDLAKQKLILALELGESARNFKVMQLAENRYTITLFDESNVELARVPTEYLDVESAKDAIEEIVAYIREHYSREGIYLIENILLFPEEADEKGPLYVCMDPGCTECAVSDPYSYRVHVILPAYAGRFRDVQFREFAEEVIREEMPAHILPKICWIPEDHMRNLQVSYKNWLEVRSGPMTTNRNDAIKEFATRLQKVRNDHPTQKLANPANRESTDVFVLNRTALGGTQPEHS